MQNLSQQHELFKAPPAIYHDFLAFEEKISQLAQTMKINLADFQIDHMSIRVNTDDMAKSWLTSLLKCGKILSDNTVNGRVIYLIQLDNPILFMGQFIDVVELPFPKNKCYPIESWEHIEIVMPFLFKESTVEWVERIQNQFLWNQSNKLSVKVDEPKVDGEQLPNPSIAVSFANNLQNHTCIKVHPFHIRDIIKV
ncbi:MULTISPECIES: VOC family protein [Pasteurellaceae]|uniref:YecM protein n=1 Tax=Pasteurella bettyae CCUG 2042 TaxID=1095749 RepID=I3DI32_9PAST|nr:MULTISPECIES: VOC family protein [Pasteurellaceae]EIJ71375.1 YecM protein [Pasteurella bettyae CCUG 2042]SUB21542.1 Uncharacterized protein conserved in bacteria [Pasteurella bettyae]